MRNDQAKIYKQLNELSKHGNPWKKVKSYDEKSKQNLLTLLDNVNHVKILEIGCGEGDLTKALVKKAELVVGIDVSDPLIQRAKKRVPDATFYTSSLEEFSSKIKFDVIICSEVLYYIKDEKKVLSKLKKLGKHLITSHFVIYFPQFCLGSLRYEYYLRCFPIMQTIIEKDLKLGLFVIKRLRRM